MSVLLFRDERFLAHNPGPGHPENASRLAAVYRDLDDRPIPGTETRLPRPAERPEIESIHDPDYVDTVAATVDRPRTVLDPDTLASERSYEAAIRAAGAVLEGTEAVIRGDAEGAFALVRPPGHHAEADAAMGFCLFNNVAIAAARAVTELGRRRVLVLDPDVHHGNGTQRSFWEDERVLYVSSHRYPYYPGTGWFNELGSGQGEGFTLNLPMPAGLGDADFHYLYKRVVEPVVDEFEPDLVLVSAGFDTWQNDPLGGMKVSETGYAALFGLFKSWTERHCPGRICLALEGGYDPVGNRAGVRTATEILAGVRPVPDGVDSAVSESARSIEENARKVLSSHWSSLRSI